MMRIFKLCDLPQNLIKLMMEYLKKQHVFLNFIFYSRLLNICV